MGSCPAVFVCVCATAKQEEANTLACCCPRFRSGSAPARKDEGHRDVLLGPSLARYSQGQSVAAAAASAVSYYCCESISV